MSAAIRAPRRRASSGGGDPTVHQDQLEPVGGALPGQVLEHQHAGPVLVGGGGHEQRGHREAGHVDGHDALGALDAAVGAAAVVEGEAAVGGTAGHATTDPCKVAVLWSPRRRSSIPGREVPAGLRAKNTRFRGAGAPACTVHAPPHSPRPVQLPPVQLLVHSADHPALFATR
jgi:hypothetical protein